MRRLFRSLRLSVIAVGVVVLTASARPATHLASVIVQGGGSGSTYHITLKGSHTETSNPSGSQHGPVFVPSLVTHTGASLAVSCVTYATVNPTSASLYQAEVAWAEAMWARLSVYPRCDTSPVSHVDLLALWTQVVTDRLPRPTISAHPSFGIINIPMEFITSTTGTDTVTVSTNDGPLVIHAQSWSSWQFNRTPPSGSPPASDAAITWYRPEQPGLLSASLVEHWSGEYDIGGLSGSLPSLDVAASIVHLPVVSLRTELWNVQ
ncbi:hypothetical protein [Ferrimicrobium sp.]|uniref:hypothetical protein n=1 Tax=Ferrimicrobium sp. TaxID=2926050 RepID=UPI0026353E6D|nr:hypothetical protein [Ferrimicrobium sp.]